eukprot:5508825-Prymnesium_polylepis.1
MRGGRRDRWGLPGGDHGGPQGTTGDHGGPRGPRGRVACHFYITTASNAFFFRLGPRLVGGETHRQRTSAAFSIFFCPRHFGSFLQPQRSILACLRTRAHRREPL